MAQKQIVQNANKKMSSTDAIFFTAAGSVTKSLGNRAGLQHPDFI